MKAGSADKKWRLSLPLRPDNSSTIRVTKRISALVKLAAPMTNIWFEVYPVRLPKVATCFRAAAERLIPSETSAMR